MPALSRRKFLRSAALAAAGANLARGATFTGGVTSFSEELPDMLLVSLSRQLNALAAKWDLERARITTREQTLARGRQVRDQVLEWWGPFPARCDLAPVLAGRIERNGYRVETIRYQSQPDLWVSGTLHVPTGRPGPFPAIVFGPGQYDDGAREASYQLGAMLLAQHGFIVLSFDPIGQGERRHHWNPATGKYDVGEVGMEHCFFGIPPLLFGEYVAQYWTWDGMRAIDYLLTRPDVDPARIGATGHSGGSWSTLMLGLVDERVQCLVCNQPGTLHHSWPVNDQPDARFRVVHPEYHYFPAAAHGIDYCDIYQAIAPRPMLLTNEEGLWGGYAPFRLMSPHTTAAYARLGAADRFATLESGDYHYLTHRLRLATVDWFSRWFYQRPGPSTEPEQEPEPVAKLFVTPRGSLRDAKVGGTLQDFLTRKVAAFPPRIPVPGSAAEHAAFRAKLLGSVRRLLRLDRPAPQIQVRTFATIARRGYRIERVELLTEPGIYVPVSVMIPEDVRRPSAPVLYFSDTGRRPFAVTGEPGLLPRLARSGRVAIAADLRGFGDTHPQRPERGQGNPHGALVSVETGMAYNAWFIDRCLLGMRVLDLLRVVDYAASRPDLDLSRLAVIGQGLCATVALHAAALDERIRAVICERGLLDYCSIATSDRFAQHASVLTLDVLRHYDLPHVAAAVAPRVLTLLNPVDHLNRVAAPAAASVACAFAAAAYGQAAPGQFKITSRRAGADPAEDYLALLPPA